MKKKYRDITVNGAKYAWMVSGNVLRIWLNKKIICMSDVSTIDVVTPKFVEKEILNYCNLIK